MYSNPQSPAQQNTSNPSNYISPSPPTHSIPIIETNTITKPQNDSPITRSIYPKTPLLRGTDGDDLYAEDTLPDISKMDFSKTRFKADRDDPLATSLYLSIQSAGLEGHVSPLPPRAPTAPPFAQQPVTIETPPVAQEPEQQQGSESGIMTGLFTGFVDVIRDGFDRLDELSYQIAPAHAVRRFRGGAPPAATKEREKLQTILIGGEEMVNQKDCPICCCDWDLGESAKLMPCGHCFHEQCLTPWLVQRNSCPICRYELSTEDRRYERYREQRDQKS